MKKYIILSLVLALAVMTLAGLPSAYAQGSLERAIAQGWYEGTNRGHYPNRYARKGEVVSLIDKNNTMVVGPSIIQTRGIIDFALTQLDNEVRALKAREGKLVKRLQQLENAQHTVMPKKLFWYSADTAIIKNDALDLTDIKIGLDLELLGVQIRPYYGWVRSTVYSNDNQMVGVKIDGKI